MRDFYLVQRFGRSIGHDGPITKPDQLSVEYMGSSEFEFGALPKAYKAMRALKLVRVSVEVKAFDTTTTFYVVAPADQVDSLQTRFQAWFDGELRSKEHPYLDRVITRKGWRGEALSDEDFARLPIAWWALAESFFFSLDESLAKMWLDAMAAQEPAMPQAGPMVIL